MYGTIRVFLRHSGACRACGQTEKPPSKLEVYAYDALATPNDFGVWAAEVQILEGTTSPVDLFFLEHGLLVELDGKQHFEGSIHGQSSFKYRQADLKKNNVAWEQKFGMVRVHHKDMDEFMSLVGKGIALRTEHPGRAFCLFSSSAPDSDRFEWAYVVA